MSLFGAKIKEDDIRQSSLKSSALLKKQERQVEEYQKVLERYNESIQLMETLLQDFGSKECNGQMDRVQIALDLKYLKEQGEQFHEQLQTLSTGHIAEIDHSMERMQTAMTEMEQQWEEQKELFDQILKKCKSQKKTNIFLVLLVILNLAGMVVLILSAFGWL